MGKKPFSKAGAGSVVTDEMITKGIAALNLHTSDEHRVLPDAEIVEIIWQAMASVRADRHSRAKTQR